MRFIILIFLIFNYANSQTIVGSITDSNGKPLEFATVAFKENDSEDLIKEFISTRNGKFNIVLGEKYVNLLIEITSDGFFKETQIISNPIPTKTYEFNFQITKDNVTELKEVVIQSDKKAVEVKEDTLTYNVSKFRDGTERKIEDVIKKLPGISVNDKTGEIKYNGKSIETVTLDGDDMFGYNYTLGTKNIGVDMIEQVQAIDNYSENPLLKGIENGDKVSLNLKLKKGKTDFSGDTKLGVGINNNNKVFNDSEINILQVSKSYKAFNKLSYNNIGENNSAYDFFSGNKSLEQVKEKIFEANKFIPEIFFSNIIDNTRANNNNLFFVNYSSLFKINKRFSIKPSLQYLQDNIRFQQTSISSNNINNQTFTTSDENSTFKKPKLYSLGVELKINTSKNSLLEYKSKFQQEKIITASTILANNLNNFESNLNSKSDFFHQSLIFTKKISEKKILQLNINQSTNNIPQLLEIENSISKINQTSNFKKEYFESNIKFLASEKDLKYTFLVGTIIEKNPFQSVLNMIDMDSNKNDLNYSKKVIFQLSSFSTTINDWTITPSYNFRYINQKLTNNLTNQINQKSDFVFEPSIAIKYKLNSVSFISSKINYTQNPLIEENIYNNPIETNNRLKISNNPTLELQKTTSLGLNYNNNNVYNKFELNFGINYQKNKGNYFSSYTISENTTALLNTYLNLSNENFNVDLLFAKYIPNISTTIKFKTNYTILKYKNFVNSSTLRENINNFITNDLTLRTSFKFKLNFENNFTLVQNVSKSENSERITNSSVINYFKIRYKQSKKMYFVLSSEYYLPSTNFKSNSYFFLDSNILYKPNNKHFEISLTAKNLFNIKYFSQIQTTDFSKNIFQNNLISRSVFLNLTYDL